jgi:hypothetical protein
MRIVDLTPAELQAVQCPTCGVDVGMRCRLHAGGPRNEPHVDRKLAAMETVEARRNPRPDKS